MYPCIVCPLTRIYCRCFMELSFKSDSKIATSHVPLVGVRLPILTSIGAGGQRLASQNAMKFVLIFSCSSCRNAPWVRASIWLICRVLRKLFLTIFANLTAFVKERLFRGFDSGIFAEVTLSFIFMTFYRYYLLLFGHF